MKLACGINHDPSKMPTSIIFSGVESNRYWDIVVNQCQSKTVLMSYHYLQSKDPGFLKKRLEKTPDVRVFIDSGTYTFLSNIEKFENVPEQYWKDYIIKYTDFVKDNAEGIFACADLDIDDIVGSDQVDIWREEYFQPLKALGVDVCYIWHTGRGFEGWKRMCEKYDYVGFSTENSDLSVQQITKMINYAKKCGTRVHGMAVTKTELLVRVPFFSADSTTWLVGQQYGELNWFDGRSMKRLEKREWRTTYKTRLIKAPFFADWDLLINGMGGKGDTYELLRLNVLAYHLAQEHIRKRLRTKMYWLKENSKEPAKLVQDLSQANIPPYKWFDGDCDDYKNYLRGLNIDPEMPRDEAIDLLYSMNLFLLDDEDHLREQDTQEMFDYCKVVLGGTPDSRDEAIEAIRKYYSDNITGVRNDFSASEVDSDTPQAPKERLQYVEDDEYETIEINPNDLTALLPAPDSNSMPEVEAYDEELKKQNITVQRDAHGRFVKAHQKIKKPKDIYSEKLPKLACDTCYKAGDCEQYKPGFVCAYDKQFRKFNTRNMEDIMDAMNSIASVNMGRLQRALMFENMDGGMTVPEVNGLIDQNMRILKQMSEMNNARALVTKKTVFREDGSQETVTHMSVNPQGGGILSKIFGMGDTTAQGNEEDVDCEVHDVDFKVDNND